MKLYPQDATISDYDTVKSTEGLNTNIAKAIIRIAVGLSDGPLEDYELVRIVSGNLSKNTLKILKPLRGNARALLAKIAELNIPIVSSNLTEEERLEIIYRAKNNMEIVGHRDCRSLRKSVIMDCIREVIEERQDSWVYPNVEI